METRQRERASNRSIQSSDVGGWVTGFRVMSPAAGIDFYPAITQIVSMNMLVLCHVTYQSACFGVSSAER